MNPNALSQLQTQLDPPTAVLLSHPSDITYFGQFAILVPEEREALILVTKNHTWLFHTSFSPVSQRPDITTVASCSPSSVATHLNKVIQERQLKTLLLDEESLHVNEFKALQPLAISLEPLDHQLLWQVRMIKHPLELDAIRKAGRIAADVFTLVQKKIQPGMTELELKQLVDTLLFEAGSSKPAFPTIVAFDEHAALPHHQPSSKKLAKEMAILLDFGATFDGYRSDMTRTWWFGQKPTALFSELSEIVQTAYAKATVLLNTHSEAAKPLTARDLDQVVRTHIGTHGYGEYFIHTTGHGVGLDIHEQPSLHQRSMTEITPGMAITIEPGIYLPGKYGVRHENTLIINDDSFEEVTVA